MLRSMFAGVSGLRSHQTMMDVTGNNIANVNTSGYKSSRTTFQETLVQAVRGGTAGVANAAGGVNPLQIGLGSKVSATDTVFGQGASQLTGRSTDVAIQGDGFFLVEANGEQAYTRAGAFSFDAGGNLVGPNGELVMGWPNGDPVNDAPFGNIDTTAAPGPINIAFDNVDANGAAGADGIWDYSDINIGGDGNIMGRDPNGNPVTLGRIALARFANPGGLERVGDGLYRQAANSGAAQIASPGDPGFGNLQAGTLEMSNVDLAQEFTNLIMAQRGFQANSRVITSSDEILQDLVNIKR